jgi:hypothetical protein
VGCITSIKARCRQIHSIVAEKGSDEDTFVGAEVINYVALENGRDGSGLALLVLRLASCAGVEREMRRSIGEKTICTDQDKPKHLRPRSEPRSSGAETRGTVPV